MKFNALYKILGDHDVAGVESYDATLPTIIFIVRRIDGLMELKALTDIPSRYHVF